jgi:hypothetical protein
MGMVLERRKNDPFAGIGFKFFLKSKRASEEARF